MIYHHPLRTRCPACRRLIWTNLDGRFRKHHKDKQHLCDYSGERP